MALPKGVVISALHTSYAVHVSNVPDPGSRPLTVLLVIVGSHGDVHPFLGMGLELKRRGHRVVAMVNAHFEPLVRAVGLEFVSLGEANEYRELVVHPDLWHSTRGPKLVFRAMAEGIRRVYDAVVKHYVPGNTVVAHAALGLGARVAQEKFNIPTATVHLQPAVFRSAIDPPRLPGMILMSRHAPRLFNRAVWALADRLVLDPLIAPPLNLFRAELGLPPVRRVLDQWWNSPDRVIGLFPDWFAARQPDWPPQTRLTDFPLWDESGTTPLPEKLLAFLDAGSPPIVFTPGSAMWRAQDFFRQSARAVGLINRRAVLLSRHAAHIPPDLPSNVVHFDYAPFSQLLPRSAAIVHHGGIGTAAQALAAGIPQLITPFTHDQPDNAARLAKLGVSGAITPKRYVAQHVATQLSQLIANASIKARCAQVAGLIRRDGISAACDLIEQLAPAPD